MNFVPDFLSSSFHYYYVKGCENPVTVNVVSWRLLASDEPDIGFNVYRTTDGITTKLNSDVLTGGTNFTDTTVDLTKNNTYCVTTIYNGVETPADGEYSLKANPVAGAEIIPIHQGGTIHFVWVGDFIGDGKVYTNKTNKWSRNCGHKRNDRCS
ncbi:MAG: hypothetical protein MR503_03870 [Oscillospiraceae bacterium]|nr:hypothetical protein [Oscillospiraceae bacterium]